MTPHDLAGTLICHAAGLTSNAAAAEGVIGAMSSDAKQDLAATVVQGVPRRAGWASRRQTGLA